MGGGVSAKATVSACFQSAGVCWIETVLCTNLMALSGSTVGSMLLALHVGVGHREGARREGEAGRCASCGYARERERDCVD